MMVLPFWASLPSLWPKSHLWCKPHTRGTLVIIRLLSLALVWLGISTKGEHVWILLSACISVFGSFMCLFVYLFVCLLYLFDMFVSKVSKNNCKWRDKNNRDVF